MCRVELSTVIAWLKSKLRETSGNGRGQLELVPPCPCCPLNCEYQVKEIEKTLLFMFVLISFFFFKGG